MNKSILILLLFVRGILFGQNENFISFDSIVKMGYDSALRYNDSLYRKYLIGNDTSSIYKEHAIYISDMYIVILRNFGDLPRCNKIHIDSMQSNLTNYLNVVVVDHFQTINSLIYLGKEAYYRKEYDEALLLFNEALKLDEANSYVLLYLKKCKKKIR